MIIALISESVACVRHLDKDELNSTQLGGRKFMEGEEFKRQFHKGLAKNKNYIEQERFQWGNDFPF